MLPLIKSCLHNAIYFSLLLECLGFSVTVAITICEHLHTFNHIQPFRSAKIAVAIAPFEQPLIFLLDMGFLY